MPFVEDITCPTMYTNGSVIGYNPIFVELLSLDEVKCVMCHEVLHLTNLHHLRRNNRDMSKWNSACDYAINPIIIEAGWKLPKKGLLNPAYNGMYAEKIYNLLPDSNEQKQSSDPGRCGEIRDFKNKNGKTPSEAEKKKQEQDIIVAVQKAYNVAKRCGNMPTGLERLIKEIIESEIDWKSVLSRFLTENDRNDYTWKLPNTRYLYAGLYLPRLQSEQIGRVMIHMDASGSIGKREMEILAGEAQAILDTFKVELYITYFDSKFQGIQKISADDVPLSLNPKGGGGTSYIPSAKYIEEQELEPDCVIYMTDGYCNSFPEPPDYPVLWLITGKRDFVPPFGEVIYIKEF
uniref:Putative metal-dependent peptidase n=1 Tax=viral metagenome TaxID=1070528 RepID=A0A6H1ZCG4_9ZZZZ